MAGRRRKRTKMNYDTKKRGGRYQQMTSTRQPFARKFKTSLKYAETFSLDVGIGGIAVSHIFRLNSCFDPDVTFIGHQPKGFDEIMALYDHGTVIAVKWKITASNTSGTTLPIFGYMVSDGDPAGHIAAAGSTGLIEDPEMHYQILGSAAASTGTKRVTGSISPPKFLGKNGSPLSDGTLAFSATANPTENVFLGVWAAPVVIGTDLGVVNFVVELEYICVFHEPKNLSQS